MRCLKSLYLRFGVEPGRVSRIPSGCLKNVADVTRYSQLSSLSLHNCEATDIDLMRLLGKMTNSLRRLMLGNVRLVGADIASVGQIFALLQQGNLCYLEIDGLSTSDGDVEVWDGAYTVEQSCWNAEGFEYLAMSTYVDYWEEASVWERLQQMREWIDLGE